MRRGAHRVRNVEDAEIEAYIEDGRRAYRAAQPRRVRAGESFHSDGLETVQVFDEIDGQTVTFGTIYAVHPGIYQTAARTYRVEEQKS